MKMRTKSLTGRRSRDGLELDVGGAGGIATDGVIGTGGGGGGTGGGVG